MKIKTWLPVFSGFYNTMWDITDADDGVEQNLKEDGLADEEIEEIYNLNCYDIAYKEYEENVALECCYAIQGELKDFVAKIDYQSLQNDTINVEITLNKHNIARIKKFMGDNYAKWELYLHNTYTSYDGFYSSYDNTANSDDWKDIEGCLADTHKLGAILEFILELKEYSEYRLYEEAERNYLVINAVDARNELANDGFYTDKPELVEKIEEQKYQQELEKTNMNFPFNITC